MECFNGNFLDPLSSLGVSYTPTPLHPYTPTPLHPYTPTSPHLTFPLVTRVHLRRPSDFRLTFANTEAVIHNKASCCFHFVFLQ